MTEFFSKHARHQTANIGEYCWVGGQKKDPKSLLMLPCWMCRLHFSACRTAANAPN